MAAAAKQARERTVAARMADEGIPNPGWSTMRRVRRNVKGFGSVVRVYALEPIWESEKERELFRRKVKPIVKELVNEEPQRQKVRVACQEMLQKKEAGVGEISMKMLAIAKSMLKELEGEQP